jgi:hypothetical protein
MAQDIVGSHFAPDAFAGQNGDNTPSSLLPGQTVKRGKDAKSIMKGTEVTVQTAEWQTRKVSAAQKVPTTPGMKNPNASPAKIPATTNRGSIAQHMARQGHAKRR